MVPATHDTSPCATGCPSTAAGGGEGPPPHLHQCIRRNLREPTLPQAVRQVMQGAVAPASSQLDVSATTTGEVTRRAGGKTCPQLGTQRTPANASLGTVAQQG